MNTDSDQCLSVFISGEILNLYDGQVAISCPLFPFGGLAGAEDLLQFLARVVAQQRGQLQLCNQLFDEHRFERAHSNPSICSLVDGVKGEATAQHASRSSEPGG